MANQYEFLPLPSHSAEGGQYDSPELLYSYAKFTQEGGTLAGGQGVLLLGTILARGSGATAGKLIKYAGTGVPVGFLRRSADSGAAGAPDQLVNVVYSGIVKLEVVQAANSAGNITTAVTALNGRQDDAYAYISF